MKISWPPQAAAVAASAPSGAQAAAEFKIATADKRGTYFAIGADLAKYVAPGADISLEVMSHRRLGGEHPAPALRSGV
jgi:TRAP-type uncharacterized transport system substrate-binding protein